MLEELDSDCAFPVYFLDSSFTATWHISLNEEMLKIKADWVTAVCFDEYNIHVKNIEKIPNSIKVDKIIFINEWNNLLKVLKQDLLKAGYSDNLDGFEYLNRLN